MKKILYILALAVLVVSCKDLLNTAPHNQLASENMWTTQDQSKAGVDGLMYSLQRRVDGISTLIPGNGSGGYNRLGMEGYGYTSIFDGGSGMSFLREPTKKASGTDNAEEWMSMFTVVHACNRVINNLKLEVVGEKLYHQYICEARAIRAFAYSRLVQVFGMVPIYLEETDNVNCNKTQSSWDEVWDMIIKECTACIDDPYFQTNNFGGERYLKPSKGMAYAIRGNAYMWLAANKNEEIGEGGTNISPEKEQEYYHKAELDFDEVGKCGFALWTGPWEELFLEKNEHNTEMIFPLEFTTTSGYASVWSWIVSSRSNLDGWNRLVASADFVDDFKWNDGTEFNWTQLFPDWKKLTEKQRQVFFLRDSLDSYAKEVEELGTNAREKAITLNAQRDKAISQIGDIEVYNKYYLNIGNEARLRTAYDTRDPRLDKLVCTPYKPYTMFNQYISAPISFELRWPRFKRQDDVDDSDMWLEFSANMMYPWYKNVVSDGSINVRSHDGTDWPLIRYTQIYLMKAEALCQQNKLGEAVAILKEIRSRAGMPTDIVYSSKEELMEEIRYDTRIELCLEGKNFFDEIRWGTYKKTKFQNRSTWDPKSCWGEGGWKTGYYYVKGMWPFSAPLTEIIRNDKLKRRSICWSY